MARLEWADDALRHIDEIARYIEKDSEFQAKRVVDKIWNSTRRIERFPEMGAVVGEFNDPTLREILVFRYRILYRLRENGNLVRIVAVVHGARQLTDEIIGE